MRRTDDTEDSGKRHYFTSLVLVRDCSSQHFLSLPFFLPVSPTIHSTFLNFASSPSTGVLNVPVPSALLALAVNVFTQGICIRGVNRLTSVSRSDSQTDRSGSIPRLSISF